MSQHARAERASNRTNTAEPELPQRRAHQTSNSSHERMRPEARTLLARQPVNGAREQGDEGLDDCRRGRQDAVVRAAATRRGTTSGSAWFAHESAKGSLFHEAEAIFRHQTAVVAEHRHGHGNDPTELQEVTESQCFEQKATRLRQSAGRRDEASATDSLPNAKDSKHDTGSSA